MDRTWARARQPEVKAAVLEIAASRPQEWLSWEDFRPVMEKHDISACFGHVLFAMVRDGCLVEQKIYIGKGIGAETPGSTNYQGYYSKWRMA